MSARGFRSVGWVAGVAATALSCYMVNLKVAAERAALEDVENRIVIAQRDIRLLQTEIGTRGRLAQLEKWNVKVLALSAPQANQFLEGSFQLATLMQPDKKLDPAAPVVLASAPAPAPAKPRMDSDGAAPTAAAPAAGPAPAELMHVASLKVRAEEPVAAKAVAPAKKKVEEPAPRTVALAKKKAVEKPAETKSASATPAAKAAKPVKESKKAAAAVETKPKPKPKPAPALASVSAKAKPKEASTAR